MQPKPNRLIGHYTAESIIYAQRWGEDDMQNKEIT